MKIITRYRKEMVPIIQALEHMPGGRKVIITDPKKELLELVYSSMKAHGGTLLIVDAAVDNDEQLRQTISRMMCTARSDNIGLGLVWTDPASMGVMDK